MPQGVIIAVKKVDSSYSDGGQEKYSYQAKGDKGIIKNARRYYVEVLKAQEDDWNDGNRVVQFIAPKGDFKRKERVSFDFDEHNSFTISGATDVKKSKFYFPKGKDLIETSLLLKIAMLTSFIIISSIFLDKKDE